MELAKVEALIEQYLEGNTTIAQEAQLEQYFTTAEVPEHLTPYKDMFSGFALMRGMQMEEELSLPQEEKRRNPIWAYVAAAVIGVLLSVGLFMNSGQQEYTQEELAAIEAFEKTKEALQMLSGNINDGIEELAYLEEFDKATNQIFK